MKHTERLMKLAEKFEQKLKKYAQVPTTEQFGTSELFFGSADKQQTFVSKMGQLTVQGDKVVGTGPIAKILADYRNKTQNAATFSMDVTADPGKGAFFTINVDPPALKQNIITALNALYTTVVGKNMNEVQRVADTKAKEGKGSGTNHVFDMDVS